MDRGVCVLVHTLPTVQTGWKPVLLRLILAFGIDDPAGGPARVRAVTPASLIETADVRVHRALPRQGQVQLRIWGSMLHRAIEAMRKIGRRQIQELKLGAG